MNPPNPKKSSAAWNPWPAGIAIYFAVVLTVAGVLVVQSFSHRTELVRADYYDQEILHQRQIDRQTRTLPLLGQISLHWRPGRGLEVRLPAEHAASADFAGRVWLYRPNDAAKDSHHELAPLEDAEASFLVRPPDPAPGLWRGKLSWAVGETEYYHEDSFVIPPGPTGAPRP